MNKLMSIIACLALIFSLAGCGNKKAITVDEFQSIMSDEGYTVQNAKDQFSEYEYVKDVYIAIDNSSSEQIEFYQLSDDDNAVSFFNNNKQIFEKSKSANSTETSVSIGNNSKYTLTTNGKYKIVSRIDNTVIYADVNEQYKNQVNNILKKLGY